MNNQVNWMQQGWECPKCGAVMSPTTSCCVNCRGNSSFQSSLNNQVRLDDAISPLGGDR